MLGGSATHTITYAMKLFSATVASERSYALAEGPVWDEPRERLLWVDIDAGAVHAGDRLPWVAPTRADEPDNFAPLSSRGWQVHVYGEASTSLQQVCARQGLPLHAFPWQPNTETAGLARNAAYLVRPDGYLAWVDAAASPQDLERYLETRGLRPTPPGSPVG